MFVSDAAELDAGCRGDNSACGKLWRQPEMPFVCHSSDAHTRDFQSKRREGPGVKEEMKRFGCSNSRISHGSNFCAPVLVFASVWGSFFFFFKGVPAVTWVWELESTYLYCHCSSTPASAVNL